VKQYVLVVGAWLLLGCESAPPPPPPAPAEPNLAAAIAELNADLLACMRRENDRLREEKVALDAKINAAIEEAATLQAAALASAQPRKPKREQ